MEDNIKILKEIGAQKIHKDTHISLEYVQAIIHGSFEGLNSIQINGFISIIEKEYDIDLGELKNHAKEYFDRIKNEFPQEKKVFLSSQKQTNNTKIYVWLSIIIFAAVTYYSFIYLSSMANVEQKIDNSQIKDAQKIATTSELRTKKALDSSNLNEKTTPEEKTIEKKTEKKIEIIEVAEVVAPKIETVEKAKSLKILPKNKIWVGYINIKTNQKYQNVFKKDFALDTSKNWLLLFGSGTVHLEVNEKKENFSSKQNMRFKYVNGVFTKITVTEFKALNKGRKW